MKIMQNFLILFGSIIIIVGVGGVLLLQKHALKKAPALKLGFVANPVGGLVQIAINKNFFKDENLNVSFGQFTCGNFALQALVGGSLDVAVAAEFPVTLVALNKEKLVILSQVSESTDSIILKKEGEWFDAASYFSKKRKIAVAAGTTSEFFALEFFKKHNVSPSQYELVNMRPEDSPIAFANGDVDGVAMFEPFASFARQQAGEDKVFEIPIPDLHETLMLLVAKPDWAYQHADEIEKLLRALKQAERFARANPAESQAIVSSFTKLDVQTLSNIWHLYTLELGLARRLFSTMEREAQWAKDQGRVPKETVIPNFRDMIFEAPLKKVSPASIDLGRVNTY